MSRLTRAFQKIFAGAVTPSNNIAQFASTVTGTPNYTNDPATIQALAAWENSGLYDSLIQTGGGKNSPVFQELNAVLFLAFRQIQYCLQSGVPEWIATETYYIGQWAQNGAGVAYVSQTNSNINNALTDTNNWLPLGTTITGPGICKAWTCFAGGGALGPCFIYSGFNVGSVTKNATGNYTLNFTSGILNNANYGWSWSLGAANGSTSSLGSDNVLTNAVGSEVCVKTTAQMKVLCVNPATQALENCEVISVMVFGT